MNSCKSFSVDYNVQFGTGLSGSSYWWLWRRMSCCSRVHSSWLNKFASETSCQCQCRIDSEQLWDASSVCKQKTRVQTICRKIGYSKYSWNYTVHFVFLRRLKDGMLIFKVGKPTRFTKWRICKRIWGTLWNLVTKGLHLSSVLAQNIAHIEFLALKRYE